MVDLFFPFGTGGDGPLLVCLPHAGGGASAFLPWRSALPGIAVAPLQYPGRETRLNEACADRLDQLVADIAQALQPHIVSERAYSVLGYSLGGRVGYALIQALMTSGLPLPRALHVVASRPPHVDSPPLGISEWPEPQLREHVRAYGGTPEEVFNTPELMALVMPILRADFKLAEQPIRLQPVPVDIYAYAGDQDRLASPAQLAFWQALTQRRCQVQSFVGGHFFAHREASFFRQLRKNILAA